jgi:membrane protease YdiL (CAAX protease family)
MKFYDNILASAYFFYSKFKNEKPYFASIFYVLWCQLFFVFLIFSIIKKKYGINLISRIPEYYFIILAITWMICIFVYYSKEKVNKIIIEFERKKRLEKILWGIISIISLFTPLICVPILLTR